MNMQNRYKDMSFMFGPHMNAPHGVYFGGDGQTVQTASDAIPMSTSAPPAWLVADWLLARHRGEPVSNIAVHYLSKPEQWNCGLKWLNHYLEQ